MNARSNRPNAAIVVDVQARASAVKAATESAS